MYLAGKNLYGIFRISPAVRLFLFGAEGTPAYAIKKAGRKRHSEPDYDAIHEAVNLWISRRSARNADFTIDEVSRGALVSISDLSRYFRFYLNKDFRTWKLDLRINEVMEELLINQRDTVSDIARKLGFVDISNFHRRFKQIAGCTPFQWRSSGGHPGFEN